MSYGEKKDLKHAQCETKYCKLLLVFSSDSEMATFDIHGARITPQIVEFYDADAEIVHQMNISLQNVSKSSMHIRVIPPVTNVRFILCHIF